MGDKTKIGWTDATWNMIRARNLHTGKTGWHCSHKTLACVNCYAERLNMKSGATGGTGFAYNPGHLGKDVELFLAEKALLMPLRWRRQRKIFPCSMTDLFGEFVPNAYIDRVFAVMAMAHWHTFQPLTKRPGRAAQYLADPDLQDRINDACHALPGAINETWTYPARWPLPNVWLGTSIGTQEDADTMIPELLGAPAALHWLSMEPLLENVDISEWLYRFQPCANCPCPDPSKDRTGFEECCREPELLPSKIGWVVAGGESGPRARRVPKEAIRNLEYQCRDRVPFFFKQWGKQAPGNHLDGKIFEQFPEMP